MKAVRHVVLGAVLGAGAGWLAGCGGTPPAPQPPAATAEPAATPPKPKEPAPLDPTNVGVPLPDESVCEKNPDGSFKEPVAEGRYKGILRNARCEQQKFLTMGRIAQTLGVSCNYCHLPDPNDAKRENYPAPTERKDIANWMSKVLVGGQRHADGQPMACASCHKDAQGKPTAKILKEPRDPAYAQEWMGAVMTAQFVGPGGERLKCKTCHVGMAPAQPGWNVKVIRKLRVGESGIERIVEAALDAPAEPPKQAPDLLTQALAAGSPFRPAGYRPKPGQKVLAPWKRDDWWTLGTVKAVVGDKVTVDWGPSAAASAPTEVSVDRVVPLPDAKAPPAAKDDFVLCKPSTGGTLWRFGRVTGVTGARVEVALASDGKTEQFKAGEYLVLRK
jgi:hypothetical protein